MKLKFIRWIARAVFAYIFIEGCYLTTVTNSNLLFMPLSNNLFNSFNAICIKSTDIIKPRTSSMSR